MSTKQGRINFDKIMNLIHDMEREYKSIANVPYNDERLKECNELSREAGVSSSSIPIKVHVRDKETYCKTRKYEDIYNWFINENGPLFEAFRIFKINHHTASNFFKRKGELESHFEVNWKGKVYKGATQGVVIRKLRDRGFRRSKETLVESYNLHKIFDINNIMFGSKR